MKTGISRGQSHWKFEQGNKSRDFKRKRRNLYWDLIIFIRLIVCIGYNLIYGTRFIKFDCYILKLLHSYNISNHTCFLSSLSTSNSLLLKLILEDTCFCSWREKNLNQTFNTYISYKLCHKFQATGFSFLIVHCLC